MRSVAQELSAWLWIALMSRCSFERSSRVTRSCSSIAAFSARSFSKPGMRPPSLSAATSIRNSLMVRSATSAVCFSWLFSNSRSARACPACEPRLEIVDARAEHLGFLDLGDQLAVEIGDALAQTLDLAAGLAELARGGLGLGLLLGQLGLRGRKFLLGLG
jgi:hypothetical protein